MNNKIISTVDKYNMLCSGDKVLVAVSGGADSMLLLNFMMSVKDYYGIDVAVAHVEHGIRGQESLDDAKFVEDFCNDNNIEYHQLSINAVAESKQFGMGIEEYSRKRRYDFFDTIPCDKIATAHNCSDNVETLIFRLARGTGLKGACGIPAVRGKIIRPLIELTSDEIRNYCRDNGIKYRIDCTNKDNDYSRNYIRNSIIPQLKSLNANAESAIANFISDANDDVAFIEKAIDMAYSEVLCDNMLLRAKFQEYDEVIVKRVILKYFSSFDIKLDRTHLIEVLKLVNKIGKVQIKGNFFAISNKDYLRFADFSVSENNFPFVSKILKISELNNKCVDFYCDCDKIIGAVHIRTRLAGDSITPANRGCSKTLKKLFNELKIPPELRNSVAVVADDVGVIGVVGYCVDERVKVDCNTKNTFCLLRLPSED